MQSRRKRPHRRKAETPTNTSALLQTPTHNIHSSKATSQTLPDATKPETPSTTTETSLEWYSNLRSRLHSLSPAACHSGPSDTLPFTERLLDNRCHTVKIETELTHHTHSPSVVSSHTKFTFTNTSNKMVKEREPARIPNYAASDTPILSTQQGLSQPQFGSASPLRNPLYHPREVPNIFNIPKANKPRPEHHRTNLPTFKTPIAFSNVTTVSSSTFKTPVVASVTPKYDQAEVDNRLSSTSPSIMEIPKPEIFMPKSINPASRPLYSSTDGFRDPNAWKNAKQAIASNRTPNFTNPRGSDNEFDPGKAIRNDAFGDLDPLSYIDAEQANENIKALLEGAMDEDEDDKPTRRPIKRRAAPGTVSLADKLKSLEIANSNSDMNETEDDGTVEGLKVKLLPHQIDGLAWMLDKEIGKRKKNGILPKGGILADDMGLGKTIQALSLILSNPRPGLEQVEENKILKLTTKITKCTLVVAPLALIKQWESEIGTKVEHSQNLKVLIHHGSSRTKRPEDLKKYDIVITTYQTLSSEHAGSSPQEDGFKVGCFGIHWYRVILDEAHSIKNRNAKMSKAACALEAVYRWCLTGTPMQNNLDELQSLIHFLRIKPYSDLNAWKTQISAPMKNGRGGLAMKRIQYFLKAFMKRRTKDILKREGALTFGKSLSKLPGAEQNSFKIVGRHIETVVCDFNPEERVFYNGLAARTEKRLDAMMSGERNDYIGALVLLLRLRQTCNHPELIRGNFRKERETFGISNELNTPRKKNSTSNAEVDDIADMFGSLTVETLECYGCRTALTRSEASAGATMCSSCENGLRQIQKLKSQTSVTDQREARIGGKVAKRRYDRRILDSDDEDNDSDANVKVDEVDGSDDENDSDESEAQGHWIGPKIQRVVPSFGVAGDTDDEDAEGGGEWLGDEDSDTEIEAEPSDNRDPHGIVMPRSGSEDQESPTDSGTSLDDRNVRTRQTHPHHANGVVCSTKILRLLQILRRESRKHKFIVFSEFTSMLDIIEPFLLAEKFTFVRYDGSMRNDDREASLYRLRTDSRTRILLCSLKCGSLGLNLTAASRVVLIEPFWNPFVEEQAIDRVHRLNQTIDVTVYRLTIADSVEERILALQDKKRQLAKAAIEGGKAVGKLSMKDILNLFKGDADRQYSHGDEQVPNLPNKERLLQPSPAKKAVLGTGVKKAMDMHQTQQARSYAETYGRRW